MTVLPDVIPNAKKKTTYLQLPFCVNPSIIDLVTVFDAILTNRETSEKLQCLYENLMSNNFRRKAVLKKRRTTN